jgi:hypothetical protein
MNGMDGSSLLCCCAAQGRAGGLLQACSQAGPGIQRRAGEKGQALENKGSSRVSRRRTRRRKAKRRCGWGAWEGGCRRDDERGQARHAHV